jgi:hypothetical protein
MGVVYRATDTNLGRDVAIKVLPDAFVTDPERLARFEREAKMLVGWYEVLKFQRKFVPLAGVVGTVGLLTCWYFWPEDQGPVARLMPGPVTVSYDAQGSKLTAIVNIGNIGDRPTTASVTSAVFVDSQKQALQDGTNAQPWYAELIPKQFSPVIFVLRGESAASVWNGVRLMEVTVNAGYDGNANLHCNFAFMGRFYPELKQIGTVSSVTSPRECRGR